MQTSRHLDAAYVHHPKQATPEAPLVTPHAQLKWSNIAPLAEPVIDSIHSLARSYTARVLGTAGIDGDQGFVILHRCGASFHFLLISVFRGNNELWEAVHYINEGMADFAPFDPATSPPGVIRPTFCVWELGVVAHEAKAWIAFLQSARTEYDLARWRDTTFAGPV